MATVIIAGPTSAGKSSAAIDLARRFSCPVISADARQCYRYLDIGTGKISKELRREIPHYNISIFNPDQPDTAADFAGRTRKWEQEISQQNDLCLYAGGSTLHLESVLYPFDPVPPANPRNIEELEKQADESGVASLFEKLQSVDPEYSKKMDGLNRQRIIRALDVWMQTGKPFSRFHQQKFAEPRADLAIVLSPERKLLHERINQRVNQMLEEGLVDEVRSILQMGYSSENQSLQTVGYREVIAYLNGDLNYADMVEKIKARTRQYAKRQLTWFRRWPHGVWIDSGKPDDHIRSEILSHVEALSV